MNEALLKNSSVMCPCINDTVKLTECQRCIDYCTKDGCTYNGDKDEK